MARKTKTKTPAVASAEQAGPSPPAPSGRVSAAFADGSVGDPAEGKHLFDSTRRPPFRQPDRLPAGWRHGEDFIARFPGNARRQ